MPSQRSGHDSSSPPDPPHVFTGPHVAEAFKHIRRARSLLIDSLPKIGVNVEPRWQEMVRENPQLEERSDAASAFDGDAQAQKLDAIYHALVREEDTRCAPIERLHSMCDNDAIACLATAALNNPFRALERADLKTAEEFCRKASGHAAGKPVPGFKASPRRAVTEAVEALLVKFRQDIDAETMHAIPDIITRELRLASREIGEAIAKNAACREEARHAASQRRPSHKPGL